ncbi:MAG: FAD-binding oxidoreductase [Gemmatimonadales bacterium]
MARRRSKVNPDDSALRRRDFLKAAGTGVGALLVGGTAAAAAEPTRRFPSVTPPSSHVVVIGAGAFGGWTAYHLRKMGVHVTLVDAYGPSNSKATSGDESRGVRSSYGDRAAPVGELWSAWARKAMRRWEAWDHEWSPSLKTQLFYRTGDLYMRSDWEPAIKRTKEIWEKAKVPHEVLSPDECRYRWPQINIENITAILYEPDAGVVRARRAMQAVAQVTQRALGVKLIIARAKPGEVIDGRMHEVALINGDKLRADAFVFACGPWLPKVLPEVMGNRMRIPLGQVAYYGTPPGSNRFTYPSMPSYNFPGVTGWVAFTEDSRGFRVRGTESGPRPSGTPIAAGSARDSTGGRGATDGADSTGRDGAARGGRGQGGFNRIPADPLQNDPDTSVRWFDIHANTRQRDFVNHRFPEMTNAPVLETRCCHYDQTSSRNFIVDLIPGISNAWIAGGGNAEAFKSGPVIGEYVAHRVIGVHDDPDIAKQFLLPKDVYPAPTSADSSGRGGRGAGRGAADSGRGGRGVSEFE